MIAQLLSAIEERFGVAIGYGSIFDAGTPRLMAALGACVACTARGCY